jgi:hypothetical protein
MPRQYKKGEKMPDERFMKWWESIGKRLAKEEYMDYSIITSNAFMSGLEEGAAHSPNNGKAAI